MTFGSSDILVTSHVEHVYSSHLKRLRLPVIINMDVNREEDEMELEMEFYRSEDDASTDSEDGGLNIEFQGEIRDEEDGDNAGDNDDDQPVAAAYGVAYGQVQFRQYEPIAPVADQNIGDAEPANEPDNDRLLTLDW